MELIPKKHRLLELFKKEGSEYHVDDVLLFTGIVSVGSLKTTLSELRAKGITDIRMKFNYVRRV